MPSTSKMGRVARPMGTWAMLNSPTSPRRLMNIGMGMRQGMHRLAMALTVFPKPLDCMKTVALRPTAYPPAAMPMASSSRVQGTTWKKGSSSSSLVTLKMLMSGT